MGKHTVIIFSISVSGHLPEFLHHIYEVCLIKKHSNYVFVLPKDFETIKYRFNWPSSPNIVFDYISEDEVLNHKNAKGMYRPGIIACKILNIRVEQYSADLVFTPVLGSIGPFAPLFIKKSVRISGIIYDIYKYALKSLNNNGKLKYLFDNLCLRVFPGFKKLLVLNDRETPDYLNRKYMTRKYVYLPDPYIPLEKSKRDLRVDYNCRSVVFSHFGALAYRKGTLMILDAIKLLPQEVIGNSTFIFAGRINDEIKSAFYQEVENMDKQLSIIVKDEYCPYNYLSDLCEASDFILLPYLATTRSSGIIGYASQFKTPVIASGNGFLGHLVREYKLGVTIEKMDAASLAQSIKDAYFRKGLKISNTYLNTHKVEDFKKVIADII